MTMQKATKAQLLFSDSWVEYQCERRLIMVPKYMLTTATEDFSPKSYRSSGLPFVSIVRNDNGIITEMQLSSGLVRAVPIFYALSDSVLYVSDLPGVIRHKLGFGELDRLSMLEFLSFGYVNSNRTLITGIYSLQAGEVLLFKGGELEIKTQYLYDSLPIEERSYKELCRDLKSVSEKIFHELIVSLKGKTAVVPLSGGYDSRFIVSMLKMGGVRDVICLSYGIPGNSDTEISREVAKKLQYEWHYVPYTLKGWEEVFHGEAFLRYINLSNRYVSIPIHQELPLLLETSKLLAGADFVFIPGHTGDFVSGGHIIPECTLAKDRDSLTSSVLKKHYKFRKFPVNESVRNSVHEQCKKHLEAGEHFFRAFEIWNWRERQAKFITNENRVYEFFDYRWAMPLWDKRFTDFWSTVPSKWKFAQKLYDRFLEKEVFERLSICFDRQVRRKGQSTRVWGMRRAMLASRYKDLYATTRKIKRYIKRTREFSPKPNPCGFDVANPILLDIASAWNYYGIVNSICRQEFHDRGPNPYSYVSEFLLAYLLTQEQLSIGDLSEYRS